MRLFIGISPDAPARMALRETARLLKPIIPGRYVDEWLYHITLAFLGEVDARRVPDVCAAMRQVARETRPFAVALGALGSFGSVLWRGVEDDTALRALAEKLRGELDAASLPFDAKPFRAHITLARDASMPPECTAQSVPEAAFFVGGITLFESTRAQGVLRYIPRAEVDFA